MRLLSRAASAFVAAIAVVASCRTLTFADASPSPSPSFAMPPAMAPPSPPPALKPTCPEVPVFTSHDGKTYVVAFSNRSPYAGTVAMTIYTSTSTYAANVPIAVELPGHDVGFRSLPFIVVNPSSEPFTAAEFTFAGSHVVGGCAQRFRMTDLIQRDLDIRAAYAELDPSRPPTQLLKVIGEGTTVTCKDPYASARFDGPPVAPDYPAMARALGQTGTTLVKVSLTDTGAVDAVAIYRSSGSDALDRSALNAAQRSHYKPQLFRCDPVAGAYLYTANFAAGN